MVDGVGVPIREVLSGAAGVPSVGFPPPLPSIEAPSSMFGTIKLSRDIKLYFITKHVNRLQRWDVDSKSSNSVL